MTNPAAAETPDHPHAINPVRADRAEAFSVKLIHGYLWRVQPESRDDIGEYGYHGLEPPCGAEWVADDEAYLGYLVITGSNVRPNCAEGWHVDAAIDVESGDHYADGAGTTTFVHVDSVLTDDHGDRVAEATVALRY
jgi:hypothetical protein